MPWIARSWAVEERKNFWNSPPCSSVGMPMPVSRTAMHGLVVVDVDQPAADRAAVLGELHRVAEQVDQHPLELGAVAEHGHRLAGRSTLERQVATRQQRPHRLLAVADERRPGRPGSRSTRTRPGVEAAEHQQVVADHDQPLAVAGDGLQQRQLVRQRLDDRAVGEHLGVADDAGHRRAQLVADGRDELVLGLVELAQPLDRRALLVERRDQHLLAVPLLGDVAADAQVAALGGERVLRRR